MRKERKSIDEAKKQRGKQRGDGKRAREERQAKEMERDETRERSTTERRQREGREGKEPRSVPFLMYPSSSWKRRLSTSVDSTGRVVWPKRLRDEGRLSGEGRKMSDGLLLLTSGFGLGLTILLDGLEVVEGVVLEEGGSRLVGVEDREHLASSFGEEFLSVSRVGDGFAFLGVVEANVTEGLVLEMNGAERRDAIEGESKGDAKRKRRRKERERTGTSLTKTHRRRKTPFHLSWAQTVEVVL